LAPDFKLDLRDGFAFVDTQDFGLGGDRISNENRGRKFPILAQKYGPGSRHIHRNESVEQASCQSPLNNELPELGIGSELFVKMERISVAADLSEFYYVFYGKGDRAGGFLSKFEVHAGKMYKRLLYDPDGNRMARSQVNPLIEFDKK